MQPEIFYTMLAVAVLLTPMALQSEVRRVFGWSIDYIRALLITGVQFGTTVMSAYIASRIVPIPDAGTTSIAWLSLELLLGLCMLLIGLVCAVAASGVLLRSPSGYPIPPGHSFQIIGALCFHAGTIFLALTFSLSIGVTHC